MAPPEHREANPALDATGDGTTWEPTLYPIGKFPQRLGLPVVQAGFLA